MARRPGPASTGRAPVLGTQAGVQLPSRVVWWTWKGEVSRSSRGSRGCVGDAVSVGTVTTLALPGFPLDVTTTGPVLKCKGQLPRHPLRSLSEGCGCGEWQLPAFRARNPAGARSRGGDLTPGGLLRPPSSSTAVQRGRRVTPRSAARSPEPGGSGTGRGPGLLLSWRPLGSGEVSEMPLSEVTSPPRRRTAEARAGPSP